MDWQAVGALGTWAATMVALWLGWRAVHKERKNRVEQADLLRYQLRLHLWEIERFLGRPEDPPELPRFGDLERRSIDRLKALWVRTNVLTSAERKMLDLLLKAFVAGAVNLPGDEMGGWTIQKEYFGFIRAVLQRVKEDLGFASDLPLTYQFMLEWTMNELHKGRGIKSA